MALLKTRSSMYLLVSKQRVIDMRSISTNIGYQYNNGINCVRISEEKENDKARHHRRHRAKKVNGISSSRYLISSWRISKRRQCENSMAYHRINSEKSTSESGKRSLNGMAAWHIVPWALQPLPATCACLPVAPHVSVFTPAVPTPHPPAPHPHHQPPVG